MWQRAMYKVNFHLAQSDHPLFSQRRTPAVEQRAAVRKAPQAPRAMRATRSQSLMRRRRIEKKR